MDSIIVNAVVWSDGNTLAGDAVGIKGDKIAMLGTSVNVLQHRVESTRVIDAKGAFVCPGFVDSHLHFLDGGLRLLSVKLRDVKSRAQFAERVAAFANTVPHGEWILGGDWSVVVLTADFFVLFAEFFLRV